MIDILSFEEVERHKTLIPEPSIKRVAIDYGEAGAWKRTWMYLTMPNQFMIDKDWKFTLPNGQKAEIREGFVYDGASIPFFVRPFITAFGPLNRSGGIHDYGYRFGHLRDWEGNKIFVDKPRKFWDDSFRDIGAYTSHLKGLAEITWAAVRSFGSIPWKKHRKNNLTDDYLYPDKKGE